MRRLWIAIQFGRRVFAVWPFGKRIQRELDMASGAFGIMIGMSEEEGKKSLTEHHTITDREGFIEQMNEYNDEDQEYVDV